MDELKVLFSDRSSASRAILYGTPRRDRVVHSAHERSTEELIHAKQPRENWCRLGQLIHSHNQLENAIFCSYTTSLL
jgi:hypothetical protein